MLKQVLQIRKKKVDMAWHILWKLRKLRTKIQNQSEFPKKKVQWPIRVFGLDRKIKGLYRRVPLHQIHKFLVVRPARTGANAAILLVESSCFSKPRGSWPIGLQHPLLFWHAEPPESSEFGVMFRILEKKTLFDDSRVGGGLMTYHSKWPSQSTL